MALPLLPLYVGLLAIFSIFFYKNVDPDYEQLEGTVHTWMKTISNKVDNFQIDECVGDIVDNCKGLINCIKDNYLTNAIEDSFASIGHAENKIADKPTSILSENFSILMTKFQNSLFCKNLCFIYNTLKAYLSEILEEHSGIVKAFLTVNDHIEAVYNDISSRFVYLCEQEPINSYLAKAGIMHETYVAPYVNKSCDIISPYVNKCYAFVEGQIVKKSDDQTFFTFIVIFAGVFVFKFAITRFLRWFAKDAFQMNKSMSDMYKQSQQKKVDGLISSSEQQHNEIYIKMKGVNNENTMTVDELKQLEEEFGGAGGAGRAGRGGEAGESGEDANASNRTRTDDGSNRTRETGITTAQQQQQQQQGQEQEEERQEQGQEEVDGLVDDQVAASAGNGSRLVYSQSAVSEMHPRDSTVSLSSNAVASVTVNHDTGTGTTTAVPARDSTGSIRSVRSLLSGD